MGVVNRMSAKATIRIVFFAVIAGLLLYSYQKRGAVRQWGFNSSHLPSTLSQLKGITKAMLSERRHLGTTREGLYIKDCRGYLATVVRNRPVNHRGRIGRVARGAAFNGGPTGAATSSGGGGARAA